MKRLTKNTILSGIGAGMVCQGLYMAYKGTKADITDFSIVANGSDSTVEFKSFGWNNDGYRHLPQDEDNVDAKYEFPVTIIYDREIDS